MLTKLSKLRYKASLHDIKYASKRNLTKQQMVKLTDCAYLSRGKKAKTIAKKIIKKMMGEQKLHTLTFDNYLAFADHQEIENYLKTKHTSLDHTHLKIKEQLKTE